MAETFKCNSTILILFYGKLNIESLMLLRVSGPQVLSLKHSGDLKIMVVICNERDNCK